MVFSLLAVDPVIPSQPLIYGGWYRFFIALARNWCKGFWGLLRRIGMERNRGRSAAVYAISVAAELVGTGQQNLRLYERRGLLEPGRTVGGTRRYSEQDLDTLRRISALLEDGLNLAGIRLVLELEAANRRLERELAASRTRWR
jgi:MerR family transcriptional regulator/heat shock protein HspR